MAGSEPEVNIAPAARSTQIKIKILDERYPIRDSIRSRIVDRRITSLHSQAAGLRDVYQKAIERGLGLPKIG